MQRWAVTWQQAAHVLQHAEHDTSLTAPIFLHLLYPPSLRPPVLHKTGTALHGGPLTIPVDGPLMVMAGFSIVNTVQHLIVVPLVHRYKMKPSLAVITFLFYGCFSVVYGLTVTGVIHIRALNPPAS